MSREAMQLALEALESDPTSLAWLINKKQAITALRQALVDADDTSQERVDETAKDRLDRENIIKLAREAGFDPHDMSDDFTCNLEDIERFAALAVAAEREACAKVCDVLAVHPEYASDITKVAAQAIRARG